MVLWNKILKGVNVGLDVLQRQNDALVGDRASFFPIVIDESLDFFAWPPGTPQQSRPLFGHAVLSCNAAWR